MEGLVESLSNEFIVGFASSYSSTSQSLIVTTDDQRNVPFLPNGNQFEIVYNVRNTYYTFTSILSFYRIKKRGSHKGKRGRQSSCSLLAKNWLSVLFI